MCKIGTHTTVAELLQLDSFCIESRDSLPATITSFTVTIAPKLGSIEELKCNSNHFNASVKDLFRKLKPGDLLVFQGIRLEAKDIIRPMNPISVYIK